MKDYLPPLSENAQRWARFLALIAGAVLLVWLCRMLYGVLTLLAVSFALAYILNPVISVIERRGFKRLTALVGLYIVGFILVTFSVLLLGTAAEIQIRNLVDSLPGYIESTQAWITDTYPGLLDAPATTQATSDHEADSLMAQWLRGQAPSAWSKVSLAGQVFSSISSLLTALILIPMFAFFFLWQFDAMVAAVRDHLPAAYRPTIVHTVKLIDEKTAEFFRGRAVVCVIVGLLTGIGWLVVGVPYSLPFGAAVAVLNLVPFLPMAVLPPVLLVTYAHSPDTWAAPVALAMVVFVVVQGLESFVLYPYFSARTSGLHPVTTIVALLIGAEVAGLLGMLLSIPIASTLKALGGEYVLPEIKRLAASPDATDPPEPPGADHDQTG